MVKEYGYEYNAVVDEKLLSRTKWKSTDKKLWNAYCLRSGRDALKVIAREHQNTTVYLPSLCCDSMITPFELYGCNVVFYQLNRDLTVNYSALKSLLSNSSEPAILLFYEYFGISMFDKIQLRTIKSNHPNLVFVRDVTHNLFSFNKLDICVDYTIASLRKWINIPDGGLLWTDRALMFSDFDEDTYFAQKRLNAQCLRTVYFKTGDESIKNIYRKIFAEVSVLLDDSKQPVKMTEYSFEQACNTDWNEIMRLRLNNASMLIDIFSECQDIKVMNTQYEDSGLYVPIAIKNRDNIQLKLSRKGIFNTIIWPLRAEQTAICKTAQCVVEHMLAVPCDQRYNEEDMRFVGKEIVRTLNE